MINQKKKEKMGIDKGFQQDIREVKTMLAEGKAMLDRASSELDFTQALQVFSKAILKITTIQVANTYLLYYYRGLCYMSLKQYNKAERDFIEGLNIADSKGRVQLFNSLGKCKVQMSIEDPSYIDEAIKNYEKAIKQSKRQDAEAFQSLGNIYKSLNNNLQAVDQYSNALKFIKQPGNLHEIYVKRGICYRQIQEFEKSTNDFLAACEMQKDDSQSYFNLGLNCLLQEHYQKALENFDLAIDIQQNNAYYLNCKALSLYHLDQLETSLNFFKEAVNIFQTKQRNSSKLSETLFNMGNCQLKLGKYQQARNSFEGSANFCDNQALKLKINYSEGLNFELLNQINQAISRFQYTFQMICENKHHDLYLSSLYHLGINLYKKKCYYEAIEKFDRIIEIQNTSKCVYFLRGRSYLESEQYNEALADFQYILKLEPEDPQAYFYLGKTKTYLQQVNQAIADFFKAMQLGSQNDQIIDGIAVAYIKANKADKALVYSNLALSRKPNQDQFLIHRSMIYIQLEEYLKAIQDLTHALKFSKNNPFIYYQRGISYYKSKQFEKAITDLKNSLQFNPTNKVEADIYYLIGICYANLEKFQQAITPLSSAINTNAAPKFYHERGKCYLIIEDNENALNDFNQVIEQQPENAFAYFRRGLAYKALKKYDEAAQSFLRARQLEPDDPRLVLNKKKIYQIKYRKLCEPGQEK